MSDWQEAWEPLPGLARHGAGAYGARVVSMWRRLPGCGPACTRCVGHDPVAHQEFGRLIERVGGPRDVRVGPLLLGVDGRVYADGQPVEFDRHRRPWQLLRALANEAGRAVSYDEMAPRLYGYRADSDARTNLRVTAARLRRILGAYGAMVETVHGVGLRLRSW